MFRRLGHSLDLFVEAIHNWFHGSVPHRMAYLRGLSTDPALTHRFDRFMLRLYCTLLFILFASAAFVVASGALFAKQSSNVSRRMKVGFRVRDVITRAPAPAIDLHPDLRRQQGLEPPLEVALDQVVDGALAAGADQDAVAAVDGGVLGHAASAASGPVS